MQVDVSSIAKLANTPLSPAEKKTLQEQLVSTLEYIARLKEINTSKIEGTNEVNNLFNIWREDIVKPSLSQKQALINAIRTHKGFFVVSAILEETTT